MANPENIFRINLPIGELPAGTIYRTTVGAHNAVPIYKGFVSYLAPTNAAVGMIVDATNVVRPFTFRCIQDYKGQSATSMGFKVGKLVQFGVVDGNIVVVQPPEK